MSGRERSSILRARAATALAVDRAAAHRPDLESAVRAARRARLAYLVGDVIGDDWSSFVTSPPNSRALVLDTLTFTLVGDLTTVDGVAGATLMAAMAATVPGPARIVAQPVATLADLGLLYERAESTE